MPPPLPPPPFPHSRAPSHSHASFILSLLLGFSRRRPLAISVYFQQLLKRCVFTVIKDEIAEPSVLHNWDMYQENSEPGERVGEIKEGKTASAGSF